MLIETWGLGKTSWVYNTENRFNYILGFIFKFQGSMDTPKVDKWELRVTSLVKEMLRNDKCCK